MCCTSRFAPLAFAVALTVLTGAAARAQSPLDRMVDAALRGPEVKKVKYVNHEFNVKKARIITVDGVTKIEGQISHHLSLRDDDQFFYTIEKEGGKITHVDFKIERSNLAKYGAKLAGTVLNVGFAQDEIEAALRKIGSKITGNWESEAELIALAIAMRVDPSSKQDLVQMLRRGVKVDLTKPPVKGRPYVPKARTPATTTLKTASGK